MKKTISIVAICATLLFHSSLLYAKKNLELESLRVEFDSFVTNDKFKGFAQAEKRDAKQAIEAIYNESKKKVKEQAVYVARHKLAYAKLMAESQLLKQQLNESQGELDRLERDILRAEAAVARNEADKTRLLLNLQAEEAERAKQAEQRAIELAAERKNTIEQVEAEAQAAKAYAEARAEEASLAKQETELAMEEIDVLRKQLESLASRETNEGIVMTLGDFVFDSSSATIKQTAIDNFTKVLDFIDGYPDQKIRIEGHTDSSGSASFNLNLSQQRADAVKNLLVEFGIEAERITAEGKGEDFPVASNGTEAGKAKNRRVDIIIIKP